MVGEDLAAPRARVSPSDAISATSSASSRRSPCRAGSRRRPGSSARYTSRTDSLASQAPSTFVVRVADAQPSSIRSEPAGRGVRSRRAGSCGSDRAGRACGHGGRGSRSAPGGAPGPAPVADPHDVERIRDPAGVIEVRRQPGPERLGQIGGHHGDPGQPRRVGVGGPSAQVSGPVAFDHVDHDVAARGRPARSRRSWRGPGGRQERGLVDAELAHHADAVGVVDERGAVLDDRVHDRPPTHPELLGDAGRPGGRSHRPDGTPPPRRGGSTPPARRACSERLGPRPRRTPRSRHRHRRLTHISRAGRPKQARSRTVDPHPILRLGARPAAPTAAPPSAVVSTVITPRRRPRPRRAPGTRQSQQRLGQPDTVAHRRGLLVVAAFRQPRRWRGPCLAWWTLPLPHLTPLPTPTRRAPNGGRSAAWRSSPPSTPRPTSRSLTARSPVTTTCSSGYTASVPYRFGTCSPAASATVGHAGR